VLVLVLVLVIEFVLVIVLVIVTVIEIDRQIPTRVALIARTTRSPSSETLVVLIQRMFPTWN
jgi:hypothetical protein